MSISGDLISDLHKDARGYRPVESFWEGWNELSDEDKQDVFDMLVEELKINEAAERELEKESITRFEARIQDVINLGAGDRKTALRWIASQETFYHMQCVEHFVWEIGILFTEYGRKLVKELAEVVTYKHMEWE